MRPVRSSDGPPRAWYDARRVAEGATKKRRRKKRPREPEASPASRPPASAPRRSASRLVWLAILAFGLTELWLFGRNGDLRVCVVRAGEHDLALVDTPRTDENTRRYPSCERRQNVGLRSHYAERVEDAMIHACRRATILRGRQATLDCALKRDGWEHHVEGRWVAPWEPAYYQRLFWFLF